MLLIRAFEERTINLFHAGLVKGTAHSSVGQEAIAAGACAVLQESDFIATHHRGHGHCIAKGARVDRMMAELMGRDEGYCRGLGGSMHIADLSLNIIGANGIVGAGAGIGLGAAMTTSLRGDGGAGIAFFGDGAANEGIFHEAMNLASIWKLPLVFMCENNQYGLSGRSDRMMAGGGVASRARSYDVPGRRIDGNDVLAVHDTVSEAIARARAGDGPTLVEAVTYRWGDHSMRANLPRYRPETEEAEWRARDPIASFERLARTKRWLSAKRIEGLRSEAEAALDEAVTFAEAAAQPEERTLGPVVYAPAAEAAAVNEAPPAPGERALTYARALNEALAQEMARDEAVFVIGEDVGAIGGIFGVTRGLQERFGESRVRDTPISEAAIAGIGVGAALTGSRPVIEIQIFDFVTHMMDMIVNQAAKLRFMLGGKARVPIVFRGPQGGGVRLAAQHSQSLEAWFQHVPGLVVIAPSTPYDAKGLLIAAMRNDGPVVFLEHKLLYLGQTATVPEAPYALPIGRADIKRAGTDVTVVATLTMVEHALAAARTLEREDGISVEVIDPRTIKPLDVRAIRRSVEKTNRLVIAHEACKTGGFGAEVAACIVEEAFDHLDAPILRVGAPDVPIPYNDELERAVIPDHRTIVAAVRRLAIRG
jgi:2-oxoisovalerate dehydrogenase E1 component